MTDLIFTVGGLAFILALIPTIVDKKAFIPGRTSLLTALVLTVFVPNYLALGLYYSAATGGITALCWWFIFAKRRGKGLVGINVQVTLPTIEEDPQRVYEENLAAVHH